MTDRTVLSLCSRWIDGGILLREKHRKIAKLESYVRALAGSGLKRAPNHIGAAKSISLFISGLQSHLQYFELSLILNIRYFIKI